MRVRVWSMMEWMHRHSHHLLRVGSWSSMLTHIRWISLGIMVRRVMGWTLVMWWHVIVRVTWAWSVSGWWLRVTIWMLLHVIHWVTRWEW